MYAGLDDRDKLKTRQRKRDNQKKTTMDIAGEAIGLTNGDEPTYI